MEIAIAHVTVEARRPDQFLQFLTKLAPDALRVVRDDAEPTRRHALRITQGRSDDLKLLGLAYPDVAQLHATIARLAAAGVPWERAPRVGALDAVRCVDPAGNPLELLVFDGRAPADPGWPVGHVALTHRDPSALERFYGAILGLRLNERIRSPAGPIELNMSFLGSPRRHHSVAILDLPSTRRLHHVCFGARDVATVEAHYAQAKAARLPISMNLGRHSLPDGTTSFYAASPSGIDVEIGAGGNVLDGRPIDGPLRGDPTTAWGHEVSVRARMRVVGALALQRLGLA